MRIHFIRWRGSTSLNRRCSATRTWAIASTCSRWSTFGCRTLESSPSKRTADGKAANYLITGPGWKGTVPAGDEAFPIATRYMVILGRTYADGTEQDYKAVNALQAQYKITPLSAWGKPYTPVAPPVNPNPGFSMTDKPQAVILAMGTEGYFNLMAKLMGGDCTAGGGRCADARAHGEDRHRARQAVRNEQARSRCAGGIEGHSADRSEENRSQQGQSWARSSNGWVVTKGLGTYGPDDYMKRAVVAAFGWPANQQRDAVYPYTEVDSTGQKLTGANKYTLDLRRRTRRRRSTASGRSPCT